LPRRTCSQNFVRLWGAHVLTCSRAHTHTAHTHTRGSEKILLLLSSDLQALSFFFPVLSLFALFLRVLIIGFNNNCKGNQIITDTSTLYCPARVIMFMRLLFLVAACLSGAAAAVVETVEAGRVVAELTEEEFKLAIQEKGKPLLVDFYAVSLSVSFHFLLCSHASLCKCFSSSLCTCVHVYMCTCVLIALRPLLSMCADCIALPCLALPCLVLHCLALPCLALHCIALPNLT
jgi:hypothetical protein